jgi:hypothetical protein
MQSAYLLLDSANIIVFKDHRPLLRACMRPMVRGFRLVCRSFWTFRFPLPSFAPRLAPPPTSLYLTQDHIYAHPPTSPHADEHAHPPLDYPATILRWQRPCSDIGGVPEPLCCAAHVLCLPISPTDSPCDRRTSVQHNYQTTTIHRPSI